MIELIMEDLSRSTNFDQFVRDLKENETVKKYIKTRNLDSCHIETGDLGFCSPHSRYIFPLLRGRLIVPIRDVHGRLIALAGRQLPDYTENDNEIFLGYLQLRTFKSR